MRASSPSPSRTKIVGDAVPDVPFRTVLVLLCRGGRPCPSVPRHSAPVRTLAWESVSQRGAAALMGRRDAVPYGRFNKNNAAPRMGRRASLSKNPSFRNRFRQNFHILDGCTKFGGELL